ncbi:MAG TPA: tRNA (adenosine(37)-N6)-threonylcarbamoyltransferase complex dimerization subunit type 1 TsaB [Candidatus Polarisedimenticolia bacterium]|nr:tRNA (adenosine(37)-N6)-threonylcarbamoyltransferase complex dimerization subunit type 1 TsaB [Candidatus Polarisedimenticolia bacterium]
MRALGIDTSCSHGAGGTGSLGVADAQGAIAETVLRSGRSHSETLLVSIERTLSGLQLAWDGIDLIGVATGPGSFTGLRIGLATARGLAMALGRPLAGFSTLETAALAVAQGQGLQGRPIGIMLDAGRGEVYRGLYRCSGMDVEILLPEAALAPGPAAVGLPAGVFLCGSGWAQHRALLSGLLPQKAETSGDTPPLGAMLARRALDLAACGRLAAGPPVRPNYLRLADAEIAFKA